MTKLRLLFMIRPKTRVKAAIPPSFGLWLSYKCQHREGYLSGCASSLFIMEYCRLYYIRLISSPQLIRLGAISYFDHTSNKYILIVY